MSKPFAAKRTLDPRRVPLNITIKAVHPVGRYGLAIHFSDGHGTGIYTFEHLKHLAATAAKEEKFSV